MTEPRDARAISSITAASEDEPADAHTDAPSTPGEWARAPWRHGLAGAAAGCLLGALDGLLAVHRPGLDPLDGAESLSAVLLAVGLNGSAGLLAGTIVGVAFWALTRVVSMAVLHRAIRNWRVAVGALGCVLGVVLAAYLWGESRNLEWHAIDWRGPGIGLGFGALCPALVWVQRWRRVAAVGAALVGAALVLGLAGWSWPGDDAADEGLLRVGTESSTSMRLLLFARERLFDGDGDRYPTALCRRDCDCDDADEHVFPGAAEIPENGADEDCDGEDMSAAEMATYAAILEGRPGDDPPDAFAATPPRPEPDSPDAVPGSPPESPLPVTAPPEPDPVGVQLPRAGKPNILFVTIDTLRADHLGYEGYERPTSPRIDTLAERGVAFMQARATGPQTRFSVPAMLASKYFTELRRTGGKWPRIGDDEVLLAELLHDAGYHTAAWHSVSYFTELYGMNQGFDHYDASTINSRHPWQRNPTSDRITDRTLRYIDSTEFQDADEPWFFWIYYGDPHSSYLFHEGFPKWGPTRADAYDSEIRFTDHHLGRLLDEMEARGMLDDTVIVLTSDHGEGLDPKEDHGHRFHGPVLHDEVMRVPLIVTAPGLTPARVTTPVSLIDLAPTLLELADLPAYDVHRGVSLVPFLEGRSPTHPPSFFEKEKETALPQKGMVRWPYKVINVVPYNRIKIYDLERDPRELEDIAETMPPTTRDELVGLLHYWSTQVLQSVDPVKRL